MKTKRVNRYYCDFCKKSGCSAPHMKKHEERCTMNPERICGVCPLVDAVQGPLAPLVAMFPSPVDHVATGPDFDESFTHAVSEALKAVRAAANNCPACVFAALRQADMALSATDFDWTKEMKVVWDEANRRELEECQHG